MNTGFNTQFNSKDKVTLEFGIILSLMVLVSEQVGLKLDFNTRFQTELNRRIDLNRNFVFRLS